MTSAPGRVLMQAGGTFQNVWMISLPHATEVMGLDAEAKATVTLIVTVGNE